MTELIRNMFRRKTRTMLTIFGITIGIFAFTVMGSMAEKLSLLVSGGTRYYQDKVTISEESSSLTTVPIPLSIDKAKDLEKVKGVRAVSANVYTPLTEIGAVSFGPPPSVVGSDFKGEQYETFKITYSSGRKLKETDLGKVVVGADLVKKLKAEVGKKVKIKNREYEVVGIMNKTLTAPDSSVSMVLLDSQKILYDSTPEIIRNQTTPEKIVNGFTIYPDEGQDADKLADKINKEVDGVKASGPKDFEEQIANATGIFNAILFGIALISLLVGGLSIINTMTMSISERTREIGIKKAVGAKNRTIMTEYLTEAGLIGFLGGLLGWALGALVVLTINRALEESGNVIFLLTTRLSIAAVVFSIVLGILAGIYPAYYAIRLNIVNALRKE